MNGLSSGWFAKTTSFAAPKPRFAFVASASARHFSATSAAAPTLMPALVEPMLIDEHTWPVAASASGIESISVRSPGVMPLWTSAEKPPTRSMPTSCTASSSAFARATAASRFPAWRSRRIEAGVMARRLLTIWTP